MLSTRTQLMLINCLVMVLACGIQSAAQDKPSAATGKQPAKPNQQSPKPRVVELGGQVTEIFKVLDAKYAGKVVKGAPYSATAITESTQTLSDGNQIIQKKEVDYYRDSQGRMRIEQRLDTIGKWTLTKRLGPEGIVMISDPVAGSSYNLDPVNKIAVKNSPYHRDARLKELADVPGDVTEPGKVELTGNIKHESLAKKTFDIVEAEGTRSTVTIPAGEIGNTLPIEVIDERWYSPELRAVVMTRHSDPRTGEVIWRLTNINRGEPDPSLFRVPADYKTEELYRIKYTTTPSQRLRKKPTEQTGKSKLVP